ncbi:unnamed protein product [Clonostachys byssicola]|uniref:Thioesterase family protein n=1 Tax=Clonostachys byssicola TaxID=160290 RepID=A0A9N9UFY2_9HYPO|nr:unnamed protein product [Clonostachys byssicola]
MATKPTVPLPLGEVAKAHKLSNSVYEVDLVPSYCVGTVPNGGFVATLFSVVASQHLASRNQPHTLAAQWSFLNRTAAGKAYIRVIESKLGRASSVLHLSLHQDGLTPHEPFIAPESQPKVVAYITNTNLAEESGVTLPTGWTLDHPPPKVDLEKLVSGTDPNWERLIHPLTKAVPMLNNLEYYHQRSGHALPTTHDYWIRLPCDENFTLASLGYVADVGPPLLIESFRPASADAPIPPGGFAFKKAFWYPTLTMTLDVRRAMPPEGLPWLRLRVAAKEVLNGRYDAEVLIFDEAGRLLALSNHVAMALDISRNYAERRPKQKI